MKLAYLSSFHTFLNFFIYLKLKPAFQVCYKCMLPLQISNFSSHCSLRAVILKKKKRKIKRCFQFIRSESKEFTLNVFTKTCINRLSTSIIFWRNVLLIPQLFIYIQETGLSAFRVHKRQYIYPQCIYPY